MSRSQSPRFRLWRWSADSDTQSRSDFDSDNAQIEALGAQFRTVTSSNHTDRPAAGVVGTIARCKVHGEVWWDDGTAWQPIVDTSLPRGCKAFLQHGSSLMDNFGTEMLLTDTSMMDAVVNLAAEANRLYRVEWNVGIVDGQSGISNTPGVQETADLNLRYKAGVSNPTNTSAICGSDRVPVFSGVSTWDESANVVGWLNNLAPDNYSIGAFLKSAEHAGDVRLLTLNGLLMTLSVHDVGPAL